MECFPPGALDDGNPRLRGFRAGCYGAHLLAMQEQPLHPPAADEPDLYRLLFLPTFGEPAAVRLSNAEGAWQGVWKRSNGLGGFEIGKLTTETLRILSRSEANEFEQLLEDVGFWDLPSLGDSAGLDGEVAVLEGVHAGRYHVVHRWSPQGSPYSKLVNFLLRLGEV